MTTATLITFIVYTFMGGYLAVCWTDLVQGSLMVLALVIAPAAALLQCSEPPPW